MSLSRSPRQHHAHKCEDCGTVWAHDPLKLLKHFVPSAGEAHRQFIGITYDLHQGFADAYDRAHMCPNCGKDERATYGGSCVPTLTHTGFTTTPYESGEVREHDLQSIREIIESMWSSDVD